VVDTKVHHELGDGAYGNRRAACERAAAKLGVGSLRDLDKDGVSAEELEKQLAPLEGELLGRARHVVTENSRVRAAVGCLRAGDWFGLGELMDASHASLRNDYEVSCPELDVTVETARHAGALGARMTGGGFGGSAVTVVPTPRVSGVRQAVTDAFAAQGWKTPDVFPVFPAEGARRD